MRRTAALLAVALAAPLAAAQSPTVTAEATETVRVKPNQAKITVYAQVKNPDATAAADEAAEQAKQFAAAVDKLKLKKASVAQLPPKAAKVGPNDGNVAIAVAPGGAAGQPAPPKETQVSRPIVITVSDPDPKALADAIDLLQKEAGKAGLESGEKKASIYDPFNRGGGGEFKVKYFSTDGWGEPTAAALGKATAAATAKAKAIADGLGMKLGAVVSAGEVDAAEAAKQTSLVATIYGSGDDTPAADDLVDGDLVRTVRVRVVFQVTK
jgi:uncharacterized protein YggE